MAVKQQTRSTIGQIAIGVAFLIGLFVLIRIVLSIGPETIGDLLIRLSRREIVLLLLFPLITLAIIAVRFSLIFRMLGSRVPFWMIAAYSTAGSAVSSLLPGGEVTDLSIRTLLLGRSGVPTNTAILAAVIEGFTRFAANSVLLFVSALSLFFTSFRDPEAQTTLLIGSGVALIGLIVLGVILSRGVAQWFIRTANRIGKDSGSDAVGKGERAFTAFFREIKPMTVVIFLLTVVGFFWEPIQISLMLQFLDNPLPFWQAFWLYHALLIPRLLPIPAGLGISEGGGALFSLLVGEGSAVGVTVALLNRLRTLPAILLGLAILPLAGFFRIREQRSGN